jgi:hypothetical protein
MAILSRKITTYTQNVKDLADTPALTATQLKAFFDGRGDNELKDSINGIVDDLSATTDGASGADQIGATPVKDGGAETVQGIMEEIKADLSTDLSTHTLRVDNPHVVTKAQVGLGNCDNTADVNKAVLSATKLATPRKIGEADFDGSANISASSIGVYTKAELQTSGSSQVHWGNLTNVPNLADASWKPSVANRAALPLTGNTINDQRVVLDDGDGKQSVYICKATTGTVDAQWGKIGDVDWMTEEATRVSNEAARVLAEGTVSPKSGRVGAEIDRDNAETAREEAEAIRESNETARQGHYIDTTNPHEVTKTQVGLGNCDNTSDANKPVSTAQQTALDLKMTKSAAELTGEMNQNQHTIGGAEKSNGDSGSTKTIDWKLGNHQMVTLTADCTFTFTAPTRACMLSLRIVQDSTGGFTPTLPSMKWAGGEAPAFTLTADAIDIVSMYYDGTSYYAQIGNDFKVVV